MMKNCTSINAICMLQNKLHNLTICMHAVKRLLTLRTCHFLKKVIDQDHYALIPTSPLELMRNLSLPAVVNVIVSAS